MLSFAIFLFFTYQNSYAKNNIDLTVETGAVWQNRNDVQIPPNSGGTRLEIDGIDDGPFFHYRLESVYRFNDHHAVRGLYAPSELNVRGRASQDVNFNGTLFPNTQDLAVNYQFNSYRVSYIYGFWGFGENQINLGFTAKARDAKITLSQGTTNESYKNFGLVPLIYFEYQKNFASKWFLNFQVDAAVAPQGRAIDAALKVRRKICENSTLGLGFRTLEGGADNEKVFTFSWFNYVVLDLKTNF